MQCNAVQVSLRKEFQFCNPIIQNAKRQYVQLRNNSENIVFIPKHSHLADLRICENKKFATDDAHDDPMVNRIYDISREDITPFVLPKELAADTKDYTQDISLDPDN